MASFRLNLGLAAILAAILPAACAQDQLSYNTQVSSFSRSFLSHLVQRAPVCVAVGTFYAPTHTSHTCAHTATATRAHTTRTCDHFTSTVDVGRVRVDVVREHQ